MTNYKNYYRYPASKIKMIIYSLLSIFPIVMGGIFFSGVISITALTAITSVYFLGLISKILPKLDNTPNTTTFILISLALAPSIILLMLANYAIIPIAIAAPVSLIVLGVILTVACSIFVYTEYDKSKFSTKTQNTKNNSSEQAKHKNDPSNILDASNREDENSLYEKKRAPGNSNNTKSTSSFFNSAEKSINEKEYVQINSPSTPVGR